MKHSLTVACLSLGLAATTGLAQEFGTPEDAAYADQIWAIMEQQNLAGEGMIHAFPYDGIEPHGMMLETFYSTATIDGHTGDLIVKRNYGPEGVTLDEVLGDPTNHLGAYTVMYRREDGYDGDNDNWFWVKYLPDGTLDRNPAGMELAGRVAKGADQGCIACHTGAGDYVFTTDHLGQ